MAQKTNLNVSPYFDDFDAEDNYYKVLFKPGTPIQSRELNNLQSILQNQIESFGSHIFKEGSLVIPGSVTYDPQYFAVKLNQTYSNIDIRSYIEQYIGKQIEGETSGVTAIVQRIEFPNETNNLDYITLYVKYLDANNDNVISSFEDGESLISNVAITYSENTVINEDTPFATLLEVDATAIGSAVSITDGIYFIRGTFAKVYKQTLILDYYTNTPSYRVGLQVSEEIVSAKDDNQLYDNAKGFNNYSAPGSDRFKLTLTLDKKELGTVESDVDFIEILRIDGGDIKKITVKNQYSLIRDYLAKRTFEESGNYSVAPFKLSLHNSLNNNIDSEGLFFQNEFTDEGNIPSDDLMCLKLSPGKAYVRGFDIDKPVTTIIDANKPRKTQKVESQIVTFDFGNLIRVNNVYGAPRLNYIVELHNARRTAGNPFTTSKIGEAKIYSFSLTDAKYTGPESSWDLYLYDIQTYTKITLTSGTISNAELPESSFVKGADSSATGYAVTSGGGSSTILLSQTSGKFSSGEKLIINGFETNYIISTAVSYSISDIKQVYQDVANTSYQNAFLCDTVLQNVTPVGFNASDTLVIGPTGEATSPGNSFSTVNVGDIVRYQHPDFSDEVYNVITGVNASSLTLESVLSVAGVCEGTVQGSFTASSFSIGSPRVVNTNSTGLYESLPDRVISSIDLSSVSLTFSAQTNITRSAGSPIVISVSDFDVPNTSNFLPYDEERYSIHYTDGTIEPLDSTKVTVSGNQVTFSNFDDTNKVTDVIIATFSRQNITNKSKTLVRSQVTNITLSKYKESGSDPSTTINDGLAYNQYYGLRVQDEEICLNYPDVVKVWAVYESLDTNAPVLDKLTFSSVLNVEENVIVGENVIGNSSRCIARVVSKSAETVEIVYLNNNRFIESEVVTFSETGLSSEIGEIIDGSYLNLTNSYRLDKGQREQYYDYSRIVRVLSKEEPSKKLLIVFDYFSVPNNDTGDIISVLSYPSDQYKNIPLLNSGTIRASDVLDFRPRVTEGFSQTNVSPFYYTNRDFSTKIDLNISPNEGALLSYDRYLGRIDKVYLDKNGNFIYLEGQSASDPKSPVKKDDIMELATVEVPPYLYDIKNALITIKDNRRYTMRDIGVIENRLENLERVTSLSLLELNTQNLQIQDAEGFNRFKTGFFADAFKDLDRADLLYTFSEISNNLGGLTPLSAKNSLKNFLAPKLNVGDSQIDLSTDYELIDTKAVKRGPCVLLDYEPELWVEQTLATQVENVNPFHVVTYRGLVTLSPSRDNWTRTIQLEDVVINIRNSSSSSSSQTVQGRDIVTEIANWDIAQGERLEVITGQVSSTSTSTSTSTSFSSSSRTDLVDTYAEEYMRSRNVTFNVTNTKPYTRYYQFLDGNSAVDFIPKFIEIASDSSLQEYGSSKDYIIGETVIGYDKQNNQIISFRVAAPNHKTGSFNSPATVYEVNPYIRSELLPDDYTNTSKVINVDLLALSEEAQGLYSGYVNVGTKLIGQTSGAVSYVKDLKLVSDNFGDLAGSFFLKDPNTVPAPSVRINTGTKTFRITSSQNNTPIIPGSTQISAAEAQYLSEGTVEEYQTTITNVTTVTTVVTTTTTVQNTVDAYFDPLAQSFSVGGSGTTNNDEEGSFLCEFDLFFANKDSGSNPITVQIRTVELGTPTRVVIGPPVVLKPSDIATSTAGDVATRVKLPYPIYLAPNQEYAIVLLAPESTEYEVFIAEMGKAVLKPSTLPNSETQFYTQQFAMGSLFLSQNGSIWTPNQFQDLKFRLYRCKFKNSAANAYFFNPTLDRSNGYVRRLTENPVTTIPRRISVTFDDLSISTLGYDIDSIIGVKISETEKDQNYGSVVSVGASVVSLAVLDGGSGYSDGFNFATSSVGSNAFGLECDIVTSDGAIISATPSPFNLGSGYIEGSIIEVDTANGRGGRLIVTTDPTIINTLYLGGVQGESFTVDGTNNLVVYDSGGNRNTFTPPVLITNSNTVSEIFSGKYMAVNHFNHGMYASNNKIKLSGILPSDISYTITQAVSSSDSTISVSDIDKFSTFEGVPVSSENPGYAIIQNEIIKYESTSTGVLDIVSRGQDSTLTLDYPSGTPIRKYELQGVSLRRINTTHTISDYDIGIDRYFIEIDRTANGPDRSIDNTTLNYPLLSFSSQLSCGGPNVFASENIQYNAIVPYFNIVSPTNSTKVTGRIRSVSGTSANGTEVSFEDLGFEDVILNNLNTFDKTRIVCSKVNEDNFLSGLPRNKSYTSALTLETSNQYLSPIVFLDNCFTEFRSYRVNSPITDYSTDLRVNTFDRDPHAATYVTRDILLKNPATSLKVIISAYRHSSADFRVLYSLIRPDSSEVLQNYELFPGYDNLTSDSDGDGYLDVVDPSRNSGLPDLFVRPSKSNEFFDYEFSVGNLPQFIGFKIKVVMSSTNQAYPIVLRDVRALAVRWSE